MTKPYLHGLSLQLATLQERLADGMPRCGWKVGINVPEVQQKLGLTHALVGWLDGDKVMASGAQVVCAEGALLHAEPELCLRLARDVDPAADLATARAAVDAVAPALELVDYQKPRTRLTDIVAHSMFHAGCVLGAWQPVPPAVGVERDIDIAADVRFRVAEQTSEPARADLVPTDLGELVLGVARLLAESTERLLAGDLILSGSFTAKALPLKPGAEVWAQLGHFGSVACLTK